MNYDKIDKLVSKYLRPNFGNKNLERRDYFKLEKEDPKSFKGYGAKNGMMYLGDINNTYYIDINIIPYTESKNESKGSVRMVFRKDSDDLIRKYYTFNDITEVDIKWFTKLIVEFIAMTQEWNNKVSDFQKGKLSSVRYNHAKFLIE